MRYLVLLLLAACTSTQVKNTSRATADVTTLNWIDASKDWSPSMDLHGRVVPAVGCYVPMSDLRVEIVDTDSHRLTVLPVADDGGFAYNGEAKRGRYFVRLLNSRGKRLEDSTEIASSEKNDRFDLRLKVCAN